MASNTPETDMGLGLGLVFGIVALIAVVLTATNGYAYALNGVAQVRITSGIVFGIGLLAAGLSIVAIHVYDA
ncbi:hypothetical protein ACFQJ5_10830 [Halomicroarcula sp. GCM10025324]|jgi:hypothetical protein|uniref:DUF7525 family protein n=1 Tax=Haloarcula TaxID=2237 RepID=UPI0023E78086|nr:hypothetical protein [Halomicroarcula sp. ZS-22-S1]